MRPVSIAVGLALSLQAMPADARETRRLAPASKWVVNYAEDSCRLGRKFGEGDRQVILLLDQFEPGDWFKMMFVGKSIEARSSASIEGILRWGPSESEEEISGVSGMTGDLPTFLLDSTQRLAPLTEGEKRERRQTERVGLPYEPAAISPAREKAATMVELRKALRFDLVLETGPMDRPLAELRKCSWDTVAGWGLDVAEQKGRTRKPFPRQAPSRWFDPSDYPEAMRKGGYEGIVNFRVMVDPDGRPTSCHIQTSTRPKEFDDLVCKSVMKRALFSPALDAQGRPVRSFWRQTVNFRLG
jgi:TonB family protein